jgi:ABC-type nitrate/sulfonate/bicarbonate transport system ATPase subunit
VLIDGQERLERLGRCAFMPQGHGLLPWRRVIDNTTLGLELAGVPRPEARARAQPLLERFGLAPFARAWPWQLSGGMRQRTAFLRTVLTDRPAMLLDEPFGALDGITRMELQAWLLDVWEAVGSTVVLITHDVPEAVFLSDRVVVMSPRPGRVAEIVEVDLPRPRRVELQARPPSPPPRPVSAWPSGRARALTTPSGARGQRAAACASSVRARSSTPSSAYQSPADNAINGRHAGTRAATSGTS